jgi:TusA-related sulfurtransferase
MIDARGRACPEPVLMAKNAIEQSPEGIKIIVDNLTARENIRRFALNKGYDIEMLPERLGGNGHGVTPESNPDYLIDGIAFDCYSPKPTTSVRNIWSTVKGKVAEQAKRIIINLDDYTGSLDDISNQFYQWNQDLQGLEELILVKNGKISRLIMN